MVCNPWSVIKFVASKGKIDTYWDNTSDTKIIQNVISFSGMEVKRAFDTLLQSEQITEKIDEGIIFPGIEKDKKASWSMLLFAGYLTVTERIGLKADGMYKLAIPNREILYSMRKIVENAFSCAMSFENMSSFLRAMIEGNVQQVEEDLQNFILDNASMYEFTNKEPEKSYHLFVLGLLVSFSNKYEVKSNREGGYGRYDILMAPLDKTLPGIIIEFKKAVTDESLGAAADNALQQIQDKKYAQELRAKGIKDVIAFGVACKQKKVLVKMRRGDEIDKKN